ncbi:hypothetical protein ACO2Q3_12135 [Caulobacter sp. KR2-114]|uniref:hypothetical protein n=1 Tax=Caulobacter sp. KR2-114 TaxID=3400912 RepID=UPI003C06A0FC
MDDPANDRSWRDLETWQRIQWARRRRGFESAEAAAESLGMKAGTYRAYERPPHASKSIALDHQSAARFARKYRVRWEWLLTGEGEPWLPEDRPPGDDEPTPTDRVVAALRPLDRERQEALADAIVALIKSSGGR